MSLKDKVVQIAVHPHACGEHFHSPFMLGLAVWFIPTLVGNTYKTRCICRSRAVHPHACGEHCLTWKNLVAVHGSSPRLWGTHDYVQDTYGSRRFIPTLVGNTLIIISQWYWLTVHPHACGEHSFSTHSASIPAGSSPRLWGTQNCTARHQSPTRFIPTLVGNTVNAVVNDSNNAVHPHACGEHR